MQVFHHPEVLTDLLKSAKFLECFPEIQGFGYIVEGFPGASRTDNCY